MAPQNQNNPKRTAMKKKKVQANNARTSSKKSPNKKSGPKKTNSKNTTAKNMMKKGSQVEALKKKTVSKMAGRSSAKRETRGLKMAMSQSALERAERANKRSALKEALSDQEPRAKKARLDLLKKVDDLPGLDLASLLATSDGVADIAAASGSRPLGAGGVEVTASTLFLLSPTPPGGSDGEAYSAVRARPPAWVVRHHRGDLGSLQQLV